MSSLNLDPLVICISTPHVCISTQKKMTEKVFSRLKRKTSFRDQTHFKKDCSPFAQPQQYRVSKFQRSTNRFRLLATIDHNGKVGSEYKPSRIVPDGRDIHLFACSASECEDHEVGIHLRTGRQQVLTHDLRCELIEESYWTES